MRSSTTGVNVVGAASSSTNATTFSAAGVTVVDVSSHDRFDLDISTLGSSRATPGAVYDSMTAGVVAVSSTGYSKRRISSIDDIVTESSSLDATQRITQHNTQRRTSY